jgi:adenine-specific DNA-methyltransferase
MKIYQLLESQLKKEPNFVSDNNELKKWVIIDRARNYDEELLELLLAEKDLKAHFFVEVKGTLIFKQEQFIQFLEQKNYLNNSYTQFKNKVGLTIDGKFLKQRNEVALVWPFKDCILEGGQSREEDKREEIFFNEILGQDEITQLLEPKVLTNAKRFNKDGEQAFDQFNRNEEGTIKDNLIVKGNNLLALHTLKEEFAGKVKLIYIDPPYNTGNDSFQYNDSFNHSTWLTFMKNRLDSAKIILEDSGLICVQCDDNELEYLKVLMNQVFGSNNFINQITVKVKSSAGFKTINLGVMEVSEYILMYSKNKKNTKIEKLFIETNYDTNYKLVIENIQDDCSKWKIKNLSSIIEEQIETTKFNSKEFKKKLLELLSSNYAIANANKVFRYTAINDDAGKETIEAKEKSLISNEIIKVITSKGIRYVHNGQQITFFSIKMNEVDGKVVPSEQLTNIWTDLRWEGIANEGGVKLKKGKKPEKLIKRIIQLTTSENDIVLDYHLGSGTTAAVAHKMNRQYIGIEQLNYGENDSVVRLQNVIKGEHN